MITKDIDVRLSNLENKLSNINKLPNHGIMLNEEAKILLIGASINGQTQYIQKKMLIYL